MSERLLPRYPIYIPSKGRWKNCLTARFMSRDETPFRLVVEPAERDAYASQFGEDKILVLPWNDHKDARGDPDGLIAARNWIKEHAMSEGHARHWQIDDNCRNIRRCWKGKRIPCDSGIALRVVEDFVDRYENVAIAGLNYTMFVVPKKGTKISLPPFYLNCHVYSCSLILNSIPHRWRLRYNDDVDLCLQVLSSGLCTVNVNVFSITKVKTMTVKGGNTDALYQGDGRLRMSRMLERWWPGVVKTTRRFGRPQHLVNWTKFDNRLILRTKPEIYDGPSEYGLKLIAKKTKTTPHESAAQGKNSAITPLATWISKPTFSFLRSPTKNSLKLLAEVCRETGLTEEKYVIEKSVAAISEIISRTPSEAEEKWYDSLKKNEPCYEIYAETNYVAQAFGCWAVYSKKHLRNLQKLLESDINIRHANEFEIIVDLGCGIGFTTRALREIFPRAEIFATNVAGAAQTVIAECVGKKSGFKVIINLNELRGKNADLVFASEYFEHFPAPVYHLSEVIEILRPKMLVIANSFGARSEGHFDEYQVEGKPTSPKNTSRKFNSELRRRRYVKIETGFYNGRPACWKLSEQQA